MELVILNLNQVTRTTPELAPSLQTTTPRQKTSSWDVNLAGEKQLSRCLQKITRSQKVRGQGVKTFP
ncbi:hypothetical protein TNCV_3519101 [Trichonephila clavipes]|uniref:Uncharacterized protein n=1 Tax=Trichonephila clavipes TaxID=2585209 RepID=A0A8X6VR89_TRICX|nr:hypothetical protein TNCV_3519101 [Trichonephila clavipes]